MFVESVDRSGTRVVWLFTGSTNSPEDFQGYCDSITRLKDLPCDGLRVAVLVVDAGNPLPDARWRKEIAERSRDVEANTAFILVGGALARGVATAINWLRPPTYVLKTAASFADAAEIADQLVGQPVPELRVLYDNARGAVRDVA